MRIARADWLASAGTIEGLDRARQVTPDNAALLARAAILRNDMGNDSGDSSADVEADLLRASRLNPLDSALQIALGLRHEFQGDQTGAEPYLLRAAEIDRQFKPAWTLANFYYRTNRPDKVWPLVERILNLEPLGFDPKPVFELCWNQTSDSGEILKRIPDRGHRPIQYLEFLIETHRAEAAIEAWPEALAAMADPADAEDVAVLTRYVDFVAGAGRAAEAVAGWNQLVERGVIHSGHLDPAKGISIADPEFRFASVPTVFGWHPTEVPGVSATGFSGSIRFEMNGDEPQSFPALSTAAPVLPSTQYRLRWKSDGASLNAPQDPGFGFRIVQQPGGAATQCEPLLSNGGCDFTTLAATRLVRVELGYARAPGTTRVSGVMNLLSVQLETAR